MNLEIPDHLPIAAERDRIAAAIAAHPVLLVCGAPGCGKTTQLAKICLLAGRARAGRLGQTLPRRIAVRAAQARLACELGSDGPRLTGYKLRFRDAVPPQARVKFLTDGMLLAEASRDPDLREYDTLILDEAHERNVNIDLLLGHLRGLVTRRADLRVLITSATLDAGPLAAYFADAPVIDVPGRLYPVEIRYRPFGEPPEGAGRIEAVREAVVEALAEGPGDVLVFLAGEREIRDAQALLRGSLGAAVEILPLYARLDWSAQRRVFEPGTARRVVLATNVAETSLTVPRIRYVIDGGTARLRRHAPRSGIERLRIEPIARSSAMQRAGRAGRLAPGVCIRLYSEADWEGRPEYAPPELVRGNLAGVWLRLLTLGVSDPEHFAFPDPPPPERLRAARQLLVELGALDGEGALTEIGQDLARLPLDPPLGRLLIAARAMDCLAAMRVIVAALSCEDPRLRPAGAEAEAARAQAVVTDGRSDFISLLVLWRAFQEARRHATRREFAAWCAAHALSVARLWEWQAVHRDLVERFPGGSDAVADVEYARLHRALLTGLIGRIAVHAGDGTYRGLRHRALRIHPGSALARRRPQWIVAAEFVETSFVWARCVARVKPVWIEETLGPRLTRSLSGACYDPQVGEAIAVEQTRFGALVLTPARRVLLQRHDPEFARELYVREALAEDRIGVDLPFRAHNRAVHAQALRLAAKLRRPEIVSDVETRAAIFEDRLPASIVRDAALVAWHRRMARAESDPLCLDLAHYLACEPPADVAHDFPDRIETEDLSLPLEYRHAPGDADDGISVRVPLALFAALPWSRLERLVPGRIGEKVLALLRQLPREKRRALVPLPECAQAMIATLDGEPDLPLSVALARAIARQRGVAVAAGDFRAGMLPDELRMRIVVVDDAGRDIALGRDPAALRARLDTASRRAFAALGAHGMPRSGVRDWDFGALEETATCTLHGARVRVWPMLRDDGDSVSVLCAADAATARSQTPFGIARLVVLALGGELAGFRRAFAGSARRVLAWARLHPAPWVVDTAGTRCSVDPADDLVIGTIVDAFPVGDRALRDRAAFEACVVRCRAELPRALERALARIDPVLDRALVLQGRLAQATDLPQSARDDMLMQLDWLVWRGFVRYTPAARLARYPCYLEAIGRRIERIAQSARRDAERQARVDPWWRQVRERAVGAHGGTPFTHDPGPLRWAVEEWRVALFAQELGTPEPVSEQRLERLRDEGSG